MAKAQKMTEKPRAEWGSDVVVDLLKAFEIEYVAINHGATFRGLHDSLVNYGGNRAPEIVLCTHEEIAVALAHGYARATGKPMGAAVHNVVGLQHASMAIYNAWADRLPVIIMGGTGPMDTANRRPWIDWVHTALVQGNLVRDFVKWDDQPASVEAVPDSFIRAYRLATTDPMGPSTSATTATSKKKSSTVKSLFRRSTVIRRRCRCKHRKKDSKKQFVGSSKRRSLW
jgi:acetolactate synthase-1/2/3 large subunit